MAHIFEAYLHTFYWLIKKREFSRGWCNGFTFTIDKFVNGDIKDGDKTPASNVGFVTSEGKTIKFDFASFYDFWREKLREILDLRDFGIQISQAK